MKRSALCGLVVTMASCGGGAGSSSTVVAPAGPPAAPTAPLLFTMSEYGVGPVDARTTFDRDALIAAFPGYDVVDEAGGDAEHPGLEVQLSGELLLTISWTAAEPDKIFHVVSYSPRVGTNAKRIGDPASGPVVQEDAFSGCECWDGHAACWHYQDRLWQVYDKTCTPEDRELDDAWSMASGASIIGFAWGAEAHYDEDGAPTSLMIDVSGAGDVDLDLD